MFEGLAAGLLWGLNTVILGVALAMTPFISTEQAIFLAPFVSTFIHDFCSTLWMLIYMGIKKQYSNIIKALKSKGGRFVVLAALLGGPIGMTGYVLSIKYIGAAYTAIISAMFPAVGAFLSYVFLKEKMKLYQLIGLIVSITGVVLLGYTPENGGVSNAFIGLLFALLCVFGWAAEAVIISYGLKGSDISDEQALQIRQLTSALFYGIIILPIIRGWGFTINIISTKTTLIILAAALFGTASYVFYYKAIHKIGAAKATALNITYCTWAIVFGYLLLNETVSVKDIICAIFIISGSILAASDIREFFQKKSLSY
ncbi:DMT family transporter [Anaerophilus nitritogenes]|uniref:DMT family transporter n=1 Tax=Anaerophilus nitritogenes TaxID=2498136 RepID=UPI00101CBC4B|nr:DMT family transporter [Anaerophilus nitritogenes]